MRDMLLRRRIITMNWKLVANKARALYYMRILRSRGRIRLRDENNCRSFTG